MFKKLAQKISEMNDGNTCIPMTSPMESSKDQARKTFLKSMSKHALNLYERQTDINNFTKLAISNPENTSHNNLVEKLFSDKSIIDCLSEESLFELSENRRFLDDIGL